MECKYWEEVFIAECGDCGGAFWMKGLRISAEFWM